MRVPGNDRVLREDQPVDHCLCEHVSRCVRAAGKGMIVEEELLNRLSEKPVFEVLPVLEVHLLILSHHSFTSKQGQSLLTAGKSRWPCTIAFG